MKADTLVNVQLAIITQKIEFYVFLTGSTIGRKIIGRVNHHNLSLSLIADEHSLWGGKHSMTLI